MFWKFWKRKKEKNKIERQDEGLLREVIDNPEHYVIEQCEQLLEVSRQMEEIRDEYRIVTSYLTDIQTIENLPDNTRKELADTAGSIKGLTQTRDEYMKTEKKISDSQFQQMQELEEEIPRAINRLKSNEQYLATVKKDMNYLEGEKTQWQIIRQDCEREQKKLRTLAYVILGLFAIFVIIVLFVVATFETDGTLLMFSGAFITTILGGWVLIRFQSCSDQVRKAESYINRAIALENHVKIKYVNYKNAVDYACEKYHVKNAYDFNYVWEKYQEAVKEREKMKQADEDLEYYTGKLMRQLKALHLYDARVWPSHASALVDKRDMVEIKHDLISRRQKLREQMNEQMETIHMMEQEINQYISKLPSNGARIREVLDKINTIYEM